MASLFDEFKTASRHTVIYGVGNVLSKALGLVLIPVYGRYLPTEQLGTLAVLEATVFFVGAVLPLGLGSAYILTVMHEDVPDKRVTLSTAFFFMLAIAAVSIGMLLCFSGRLSTAVYEPDLEPLLVRLVLLRCFFDLFRVLPRAKLRAEQRSVLYGILAFSTFTVRVLLVVAAVIFADQKVLAVLVAMLISSALAAVAYTVPVIADIVPRFSSKQLISMLKFGVPLVPATVSGMIMTVADRYFLEFMGTRHELGIYEMGYNFGKVLMLLVGAVQIAWLPVMFSVAKKDLAKQFYAKALTYVMVVLTFAGATVVLFAGDVLLLFPEYAEARAVVPWIVGAYLVFGLYALTSVGVNLKKRTHYQAICVAVGAGANLVLNWLLIPVFGVVGAAAATLVSYGILALLSTGVSLSLYFIKYEYVRLAKIVVAGAIVTAVPFLVGVSATHYSIGLKVLSLALFPLVLYVLGFFERAELEKVFEVVGDVRRRRHVGR